MLRIVLIEILRIRQKYLFIDITHNYDLSLVIMFTPYRSPSLLQFSSCENHILPLCPNWTNYGYPYYTNQKKKPWFENILNDLEHLSGHIANADSLKQDIRKGTGACEGRGCLCA